MDEAQLDPSAAGARQNFQNEPALQSYDADELANELAKLDQAAFPNTFRLLSEKVADMSSSPVTDPDYLEVDVNKPIRLTKKIAIPAQRHPSFNFVGKILGPKGSSLQAFTQRHKCRLFVCGKGSLKDDEKTKALDGTDPRYAHLNEILHCKVELIGSATHAYGRLAAIISELSGILQPVRDETQFAQFRGADGAAEDGGGGAASRGTGFRGRGGRGSWRGRGAAGGGPPPPPYGYPQPPYPGYDAYSYNAYGYGAPPPLPHGYAQPAATGAAGTQATYSAPPQPNSYGTAADGYASTTVPQQQQAAYSQPQQQGYGTAATRGAAAAATQNRYAPY